MYMTNTETTNYTHDKYRDNKLYTWQTQRQQTIHITNTETTNYTYDKYRDNKLYTLKIYRDNKLYTGQRKRQ